MNIETTFAKVREWIEGRPGAICRQDWENRTHRRAFYRRRRLRQNTLQIKDKNADTRARYERMLAKAIPDVRPDCKSLEDQAKVLHDKSFEKELRGAIRKSNSDERI